MSPEDLWGLRRNGLIHNPKHAVGDDRISEIILRYNALSEEMDSLDSEVRGLLRKPVRNLYALIGYDVPAADGGDYGHRVLDYDPDTRDYVVRPIKWSTRELLYPNRAPEALDDFKITYRYDLKRKEKSP
jgi:hypothetical protein